MRLIQSATALVCLSACSASPTQSGAADVEAVTRAKVETWRQLYQEQEAASRASIPCGW
jgi:hypothetical protein